MMSDVQFVRRVSAGFAGSSTNVWKYTDRPRRLEVFGIDIETVERQDVAKIRGNWTSVAGSSPRVPQGPKERLDGEAATTGTRS